MHPKTPYEKLSRDIAIVMGIVTFFASYAFCITKYGFLIGFGLGWLPSAMLALAITAIARFAWPFLIIALLLLALEMLFF